MSSSSGRSSLGGEALTESSSFSARASRRKSLGGGALRVETPQKDQRLVLDEWRRKAREASHDAENVENNSKRARTTPDSKLQPQLSSADSGTTALERYRMKKQLKLQQEQLQKAAPPLPPKPYSHQEQDVSHGTINNSGLVLSEDFDDETISFSTGVLSSTPPHRPLSSGRARRRSMVPPRHSTDTEQSSRVLSQLTIEPDRQTTDQKKIQRSRRRSFAVPRPEAADHSQQTLSQLTSETTERNSISNQLGSQTNTAESTTEAGLRSRLREAEARIDKLENDKMALLVAKAPLEARLQQKEEEWLKEESRLLNENESLKQETCEKENRFRDLQASHDELEDELKRFRLEAKKPANKNVRGTTESSRWDKLYRNNDNKTDETQEKLRAAQTESEYLKGENLSLSKELHGTKIERDALSRELDQLTKEYDEIAASSTDNRDAEMALEDLTVEHIATSAQLNAVCQELADTKARSEAEMISKIKEHKHIVEDLRFQLSVAETRASSASRNTEDGEDDLAVLQARIEEQNRRIVELEAAVLKGEEIRRQMHNRIQELRGNIRVFVRTRPFLPGDGEHTEPAIDVSPDGESLLIQDIRTSKSHNFSFDKVFPPSAGQDSVFQEVADFVQSALDGYHVCLFSYGQTGSGKTHTMQGSGNSAMRGIIPRAVEQVLNHVRLLRGQKWDFTLSASFLEIYNEELKDLLINRKSDTASRKLAIKRSKEGKSFVDGLAEVKIDTSDLELGMQQLEEIMAAAARSRSVAKTQMNSQSSRSHSVFMLQLCGYNEETGAEVQGALNLCDLAGSERLDRSKAGDDAKRLRETQAINKSLSCLGDVFNALAQGASHVPYRNSKLTYLLQDCLSGDGKALMFVNLSPTTESSNESLCSLRFAQRVNQVELGKPTKHIQYKNH